jgi:kynurenine formamidase
MQYFDLSHSMKNGMPVFPGDPEPRLVPAKIAPPWHVTQLSISTHTGTHMDAASHFISHGKTIDQYPLERFFVPGIVVPALGYSGDEPLGGDTFAGYLSTLPTRGAVLIQTGWDHYWNSEHYMRHPYLSHGAAQLLINNGASIVGIDAPNVDSTLQETEHAHAILLGNDALIVENLTRLDQLTPGKLYHFSFLPLPLTGLDGSPIRAVAWCDD